MKKTGIEKHVTRYLARKSIGLIVVETLLPNVLRIGGNAGFASQIPG